jgi:hypothetical protein
MVRLSFTTIAGKSYRLERSDDLFAKSWSVVADNIAGTGALAEFVDAPVANPRPHSRFYRVQSLQ